MSTPAPATAAPAPAFRPPAPDFFPWGLLLPSLAAAYGAALTRIQTQILSAVLRQFRMSGSWRRDDAVEFASIVPPLVRGAQQAVSAITAGYLDRVVSEASGVRSAPAGVPASEVTGSAVRAGVDPRAVYRRPYTVAWTELAAGTPLPVALQRAERRIEDLVKTDLQLTKTHTVRHVGQGDERIVGWRRVPKGAYSCALCLITSTLRYHRSELAPLHPNCDCGFEAVTGDYDPGPVLDEEFLAAVHHAIDRDLGPDYVAASGRAINTKKRIYDYRDIVIVHNHGEIGPVLGVRGHRWTGPGDIAHLSKHQPIDDQGD